MVDHTEASGCPYDQYYRAYESDSEDEYDERYLSDEPDLNYDELRKYSSSLTHQNFGWMGMRSKRFIVSLEESHNISSQVGGTKICRKVLQRQRQSATILSTLPIMLQNLRLQRNHQKKSPKIHGKIIVQKRVLIIKYCQRSLRTRINR